MYNTRNDKIMIVRYNILQFWQKIGSFIKESFHSLLTLYLKYYVIIITI